MYLGSIITIDIYLENESVDTLTDRLEQADIDYTIEHIENDFITISTDRDNLETIQELL